MPTRHATEERRSPAYERYMSDPLYAARRPIPANIVAEKAIGYASAADRRLLFFVQALSMQPGGLRAAAADLLSRFPEAGEMSRLAMIQTLPPHQRELANYLASANVEVSESEGTSRASSIAGVHEMLLEFCINPALDLDDLRTLSGANEEGLLGILERYRISLVEDRKASGVVTSIGKIVHDQLDEALVLGRITVIEAPSGWGKSCGAESWCRCHPGEVYFVTLSGITSRTILFQRIAASLGMATCQRKISELQGKIEAFFHHTKALLVVDEAHYLWPQTKRVSTNPEMIDWIDTLVNMGARVALICTDQFSKRKAVVEKQTAWTSDQFRHRVRRHHKIDIEPSPADLLLIASHLLQFGYNRETAAWTNPLSSEPNATVIKKIVGWSLGSALPLRTVTTIVEAARFLAHDRNGRDIVQLCDVTNALSAQESSDLALDSAGAGRSARSSAPARSVGAASSPRANQADRKQQMSRFPVRTGGLTTPAGRSAASPLATA